MLLFYVGKYHIFWFTQAIQNHALDIILILKSSNKKSKISEWTAFFGSIFTTDFLGILFYLHGSN